MSSTSIELAVQVTGVLLCAMAAAAAHRVAAPGARLQLPAAVVALAVGALCAVALLGAADASGDAVVVGAAKSLGFRADWEKYGLLPVIVFDSGFSLHKRPFFRQGGAILLLGLGGTALAAGAVGGAVFAAGGAGLGPPLGLYDALSIGAVVCACDPAVAAASLADVDVEPGLYALVYGESVLSTAMAVVLTYEYGALAAKGGAVTPATAALGARTVALKLLGSAAWGLGVGLAATLAFRVAHLAWNPCGACCSGGGGGRAGGRGGAAGGGSWARPRGGDAGDDGGVERALVRLHVAAGAAAGAGAGAGAASASDGSAAGGDAGEGGSGGAGGGAGGSGVAEWRGAVTTAAAAAAAAAASPAAATAVANPLAAAAAAAGSPAGSLAGSGSGAGAGAAGAVREWGATPTPTRAPPAASPARSPAPPPPSPPSSPPPPPPSSAAAAAADADAFVMSISLLLVGYLSYLAAEALELSGVVAALVTGVTANHFIRAIMPPTARLFSAGLLHTLAHLADLAVFFSLAEELVVSTYGVALGFEDVGSAMEFDGRLIGWVLLTALAARAAAVPLLGALANATCQRGSTARVKWAHLGALALNAQRGAVAYSAASSYVAPALRPLARGTAAVVIVVSVVLYGVPAGAVVKLFGVPTGDAVPEAARARGRAAAVAAAAARAAAKAADAADAAEGDGAAGAGAGGGAPPPPPPPHEGAGERLFRRADAVVRRWVSGA